MQTDLGDGANFFCMEKATTPTKESVAGLVKVVDGATREKTSGRLGAFDRGEFAW